MSIFDFLKKKQTQTPITMPTSFGVPGMRREAVYPDWQQVMNGKRYATVDDIYSIIRYLATTAARIKSYAYRNDEPEERITALLQNPSQFLSRFEFYEAVNTYLLQDGEVFIIKDPVTKGYTFNVMAPIETVVMTSSYVPVGYQHIRNGQVVRNFELDEVIHIKYFNSDPKSVRGLSPLRVLHERIVQASSIDNQLTAQMQNGGVNTLVFDKFAYDNGTEVMNARKDSFYRFIKNAENKGAPYFAAGDMQAVHIGSSLSEMQILEALGVPFKKMCNAFGTSDILFNSDSASTESNVQEMTKRTYTNTILPNINRINDGISRSLDLAGQGISIKEDLSEIPELQEDMAMLVNALNTAWWLTPNQRLEAMNYDRRDNPIFDEPFIPGGLSPLSDLEMNPDTNLTDDAGDYKL